MAPNFKALLTKNLDDVRKPEPIPEGSYKGMVKSFSYESSARKQTPFVRFVVTVMEAMQGVDADDLETALQGQPITSKTLRADFYLTDEALFRLKDFLASLGIDTRGKTLDESIPEALRQEVLIDVTRQPSEDGSTFYNNISKITGAEA